MDIIIPYRKNRHSEIHLKFALRAIEKYLAGYGAIFILGEKVKWLKDVEYIDCEEHERKQYCIFSKILAAAKDERVSDKFIGWHDDHFLIKPLNVSEIKYWKSGNLDTLGITASGTYNRVVVNANKYLKNQGYSNYNYDIHVPIIFEKEKFIELENEDWAQEHLIKSLYCNRWAVKGEDMKDLKFGKPFSREQIRKAIDGRIFFSVSEFGTNESMNDVLNELFPDKSKYEV